MKIKNLKIFAVVYFISLSVVYGQVTFDIDRFVLLNSTNRTHGMKFGEDTLQCIKIFGNPSAITSEYSEIEQKWIRSYHYANNSLNFIDGKLDGFKILDESILVGATNDQVFKINDKLIAKNSDYQFLDFPVVAKPGQFGDMSYNALSQVSLQKRGEQWDSRIFLFFNSKHELFCIQSYH